jgi:hypothetical protein
MSTPTPPLSEKDFIHEEYPRNPYPFWIWLLGVVAFTMLIWGGSVWYSRWLAKKVEEAPFLHVTNRQFSLFLWQNSSLMRKNMPVKSGYLPGFQYIDKVSLFLPNADQYVVAPPEILFLYHTWHRLISAEFTPRPVPLEEFRQFLDYAEEWKPQNWPGAPKEYIELVGKLPSMQSQDLQPLLPLDVQKAFQGWKNYFLEGDAINEVKPTYREMQEFLETHPHYARNYWRNIVDSEKLHYLKTLSSGTFEPDEIIPEDELSGFLKVAFFNAEQAKK